MAEEEKGELDKHALKERIVELMRTVYDPEIPVNIYDLGMVYGVEVDDEANATVTMTLTSPACPVAGTLPLEVETRLNEIEELKSGRVELVWDPPWDQTMLTEEARLQLGL